MKLLYLTPQPPFPADQGAKLRNARLIRIAAEAGHQVDLLTFGSVEGEGRHEVERWCRRVISVPAPPARGPARRALQAGLSDEPDLLLRLRSPVFLDALQRLLAEGRYDAVQAEGLELGLYLRAVRGPLKILDEHNVEYALQACAWRSDLTQPRRAHAALYSLIQWRRLWRWEARLCREADAVLAVSEADASALRGLSRREVAVVPNGVDLATSPYREPASPIPPELLFDGTISFRPNHDAATWFARDILPCVRQRRPEVRFWVVGRDPPRRLVAFNFGHYGVAVTGGVPTVAPYWERAGLYVLPMRIGGGVRFKALEAMARGLPLVSTELGMAGTGARPGRDYLLAERADEFSGAVLRLLADATLARALAASARQTVAAHDWSGIAPRLVAFYKHVASRAGLA